MSAKAKSKQQEALQFLDDLDSFDPPPPGAASASTGGPGGSTPAAGEEEVYAFIDEITQKSSAPPRPLSHIDRPPSRAARLPCESPRAKESRSAHQQAKTVVDEQVKNLPRDEARKWGEGVLEYAKAAQLDKIGQDFRRVGLSTLTDLLNVVAPPISEHEVIQVWLSHDMKGYEGVETLVYRALARILEQVEGGDLVVNRGDESRPKETDEKRDLNAVEGLEAALKLAQANLDELIKRNVQPPQPANTVQNPTTYSYIYLRIQPFLTTLTLPHQQPTTAPDGSIALATTETQQLQFLLYLSDPSHNLSHSTVTQAVPGQWLDLWDDYDWVEDLVVEAIRVGVEVIGQEYIVSRMGWDKKASIEETQGNGEEGQEPPAVSVTETA
ncbi:hypothetical protein EUX98_g1849 [Antrodiella citrinella]|uniref:Maintenance of telomere capping protein 1 n=1 Tax=Antrodiella citrinella TaxID=2447956 RepID=A0A4S4N3G2_9APHY|nr:hypothetical protein EUX98_g1849 [Antrodiella citrinella]